MVIDLFNSGRARDEYIGPFEVDDKRWLLEFEDDDGLEYEDFFNSLT